MTKTKTPAREWTLSAAARALGRHRGTVRKWCTTDGAPHTDAPDGIRVHLGELLDWRESQVREAEASRWRSRLERAERAAGLADPDEADLAEAEWRRRKRRAEARLAELQVAEQEERLLPTDEVEAAHAAVDATVRARMLALAGPATARIHGAATLRDAKRIHEAEIREALEALADADVVEPGDGEPA